MSLLLFITMAFTMAACGKDSTPAPATAPTNLTVTATVSTDNSGNVSFVATATNAATYEYDFGNGIYQNVPSGSVTYKYPSTGTYTVTVVAKSAGGQTLSKSVQVSVAVAVILLWSDEFNVDGAPDPTKWGYDLGNNGGWGNNEFQYYTNRTDNAVVAGGTLKIIAKAERFNNFNYTSARLLSKNKFAFKYGKVEVSAKIPAGVGSWPAIWMLGANIDAVNWPACGEIDIMEHRGSELNKIFGTFHYPGRAGGNADGNTRAITNATTQFHKYSMEWSASSIKLYVDDLLVHSLNNSAGLPFNHNFFFILNVAMGGGFAGAIDPALTGATMEIDYIRVYQ